MPLWFVLFISLLAVLLPGLSGCGGSSPNNSTRIPAGSPQASLTVPLNGLFEKTFNWDSSAYTNPWEQAQLSVSFTAPSGKSTTVGGFFETTNTWGVRFSPSEPGTWSWQSSFIDNFQKNIKSSGTFTVTVSGLPGFVKQNPTNPFRWILSDGSPYYPLGIAECIQDTDKSGTPMDNWGFDGGFRSPGSPDYGSITDGDTYFRAYSQAGVNLFRWSPENCAFKLYQTISPNENVYLVQEGLWGDQLVAKLRQYNFKIYMNFFGFNPAYSSNADDPNKMNAVKRYVKYIVDRYGAVVDFWELMNEAPGANVLVDEGWYTQIAAYIRSIDPYQHPISTSWERPDLSVIDISSPHWYQSESEFESDRVTWNNFAQWKSAGKPVILGEQGNNNQNWDARSALRMRLRSWTAFFAEGAFIFWNSSFAKDYKTPVAANIYLGPAERGYLKVLQDFTKGLDSGVRVASLTISNPGKVRGYALSSPSLFVAYLHAYTDHTNLTSGIRISFQGPVSGTATWTNPATGTTLASQSLLLGNQTLNVPAFTTDIALKVTGS